MDKIKIKLLEKLQSFYYEIIYNYKDKEKRKTVWYNLFNINKVWYWERSAISISQPFYSQKEALTAIKEGRIIWKLKEIIDGYFNNYDKRVQAYFLKMKKFWGEHYSQKVASKLATEDTKSYIKRNKKMEVKDERD